MSDAATPSSDQETVLQALRGVIDPELGLNIVDLGLVYTVERVGPTVNVEMTLTTPACPAGPQILRDAVQAVEKIDGVAQANVKLVMTPPWSVDRLSDEARDELGIY